jgi:hypothetical protein
VKDYAQQVEAKHSIVMEIIALAEKLDVEFAFPTRTVHLASAEGQSRSLTTSATGSKAAKDAETIPQAVPDS